MAAELAWVMPDMGVVAVIRQYLFANGTTDPGLVISLGCRGETKADVNHRCRRCDGLPVAELEAIAVGITTRRDQAGDLRRRSHHRSGDVTQGSIHSHNAWLGRLHRD